MFCRFEKNYYLCTRKRKMTESGALVQLVRMPACHAGGHEFESRTHRRSPIGEHFGGFFDTKRRCLTFKCFIINDLFKRSGKHV